MLGVTIMNFVNEKEIPAIYKSKYFELLGNTKLKGRNSFYINQNKFKDNCNHWTVDYENDCFLAAFPHGERGLSMTLKTFIFYWDKQFFYIAACREQISENGIVFLNYYQILYYMYDGINKEAFLKNLKQALITYGTAGAFSGIKCQVVFNETTNKDAYFHSIV